MRKVPALGLTTAALLALAACTGGGGGSASPSAPAETEGADAKVYSEDELRELISGMQDADGNELKLYSKEQVDQGGNMAKLLLGTAKVDPADCKDIATAGLLESVESGSVAVALSEGDEPRSLSAQSGSDGPDAVEALREVSGKMGQCAKFTVEAVGQKYEVTSEELDAETDAEETFATTSTRTGAEQEQLMQVSAAEGRLLVVATKSGSNLDDEDKKELEDLVNEVLAKADGGGATSSPEATGTSGSTESPSPDVTVSPAPTGDETEGAMTVSPSPTMSN
ncbi:hypothetical protein ACIQCM_07290 [Pseudarthrobacter sp. NPDC092439]|uniref:hypothetical protein n=1 Tax=unclassified Pseudarthrobacter TaxID=2647000 RepID=UPI00382A8BF5